MSGSIGGSRIKREDFINIVKFYEENVLRNFRNYKKYNITGSFNNNLNKYDFGDIDLIIYIDAPTENITNIKKEFQSYLNSLSDKITIPFKKGKRIGQKSQLFGQIVTCAIPINNTENYVQIDNIITNNEDIFDFQYNFLNLDAPKQALLMGLTRVYSNKSYLDNILNSLNINDSQHNLNNIYKYEYEYEFVLSPKGISLRKVYLNDNMKEINHTVIWKSYKWEDLKIILNKVNISDDYEMILKKVSKNINDRGKKRLIGLLNSVINIGVGEIGTIKGFNKINALKLAETLLNP